MKFELLTNRASTKSLIMDVTHKSIVKSIQEYLNESRFNHIVTSENLPQVKKDNAELNKSIKYIQNTTKEIVERESESINEFKYNSKLYQKMIDDKREDRVKKIQIFEDETRKAIKEECQAYYELNKESLRQEFDKVNLSDMTKLSYITAKGSLTKEAKNVIDSKIQECMMKQNRYDIRVSNLKVICYERGLNEPLTKNHIQGIVFIDNEKDYLFKLDTLINDEILRNDRIKKQIEETAKRDEEKKAREKVSKQQEEIRSIFVKSFHMMEIDTLEKELSYLNNYPLIDFDLCYDYALEMKNSAIEKITQLIDNKKQALQDTKEVIKEIVPAKKAIKEIHPTVNAKTDKKTYTIIAKFETTVPSHITANQVVEAAKNKLLEAGVTTLKSIEVE
jgi:hypothetical protein